MLAGLGFGEIWASLGQLLGATWLAFGRFWTALGPSGTLLGRLLGTSWVLLAVFWLVWGASWPHFGSQGRPGPRFWRVQGRARQGLGRLQGHILACFLLHLALPCMMLVFTHETTRWHLLWLFFYPLQRSSTCAAHGIEAKLAILTSKSYRGRPLKLS